MKNKALPIFLAFLCMGFVDVVGPLVSLAKESFHLSNFMAQLLPLSGMIMFGLLSIPMGLVQDRKGKKFVLSLGLAMALIGMIIPILNGMFGAKVNIAVASMGQFYILLFSILILGAGATTLQVAGNPVMRDVSAEGRYSSNLSLAQSVKAIGSSLGFLVPPLVLWLFGLDWTILFPLFALLITINLIWIRLTEITENRSSERITASFSSCLSLFFTNGYVLLMVLGIFVYVGAEVSMSSGIPILMKEQYGITSFGLWLSWLLFFLPILAGRAVGSAVLRHIAPGRFLLLSILVSMSGILLLFTGSQVLAFTGIVMTGLGFANIFPLIFSITVDRMPERTNELAGLMVTAIVGGAFIPPVMGKVADLAGSDILVGFVVPLACIVYLLIAALKNTRQKV